MFFVRHAMPEVDPTVPAELWHLGATGRAAASRLAPLLPAGARYVSSPEPKALETLLAIAPTADVIADPGFAEVRRPHDWSDSYRATALSYLRGEDSPLWEPRERVIARFDAAVRRVAAEHPVVIGTHGLALTVWLSSRHHLAPEPFWASLRLPDLLELDPATGKIGRRP